ncbi:MAG: hypothetical protein ACO3PN_09090, partial [Chthoniobacterales bacterium]
RTPFTPLPNQIQQPSARAAPGVQHLEDLPHFSAQHWLLQQPPDVPQDDFVLHMEAHPLRSEALRAKDRSHNLITYGF